MKKKYEFVESKEGTICTIATPIGRFIGKSKVHEEDKEHYSPIFGGKIAEFRAEIALREEELKRAKIEYSILERIYRQTMDNSKTDTLPHVFYAEKQHLHWKIRRLKTEIDSCQAGINRIIFNREKSLADMEKVKEKLSKSNRSRRTN